MRKKMIFSVLMFAGAFIDERNLHRGIYTTATPVLHPEDETIDKIQERALKITQAGSVQHESHREWMKNVSKCELVKVELDVLMPVLEESAPAEGLEPGDSLEGVTEIGGVKVEEMTESPGPGVPTTENEELTDGNQNPAVAPSEEDGDKKNFSN